MDTPYLPDGLDRDEDVTLVFLRHRGCLFTRQWIQEIRDAASRSDSRIVLVHQGSDEEFDRVLRPLWPDAEAVSDPDAVIYREWAVARGGWREMFGLRAWLAGVPAFLGGNRIGGKGSADGWTLPTMIRIRGRKVVWEHRGTHAGDHPDPAALR